MTPEELDFHVAFSKLDLRPPESAVSVTLLDSIKRVLDPAQEAAERSNCLVHIAIVSFIEKTDIDKYFEAADKLRNSNILDDPKVIAQLMVWEKYLREERKLITPDEYGIIPA